MSLKHFYLFSFLILVHFLEYPRLHWVQTTKPISGRLAQLSSRVRGVTCGLLHVKQTNKRQTARNIRRLCFPRAILAVWIITLVKTRGWWHLFTQSACCHVSSSHSYRVIYGHFHLAIFISMYCCAFFIHRKCSKAERLFDCFDPWENTTHSSLRGLILGLFEFILKARSVLVRFLFVFCETVFKRKPFLQATVERIRIASQINHGLPSRVNGDNEIYEPRKAKGNTTRPQRDYISWHFKTRPQEVDFDSFCWVSSSNFHGFFM